MMKKSTAPIRRLSQPLRLSSRLRELVNQAYGRNASVIRFNSEDAKHVEPVTCLECEVLHTVTWKVTKHEEELHYCSVECLQSHTEVAAELPAQTASELRSELGHITAQPTSGLFGELGWLNTESSLLQDWTY